jgi:hypothetical protein
LKTSVTPGTTNLLTSVTPQPPAIGFVTRNVEYPAASQDVVVSATVASVLPLTSVKVYVDSGSGFGAGITMAIVGGTPPVYEASIGSFTEGTFVKYYVEATNITTVTNPRTAPLDAKSFLVDSNPPDGSELIINEVMYDAKGGDNSGRSEYIELYNRRPTAIDLSHYIYSDQFGGDRLEIPAGTTIAGNGYLVLSGNKALHPADYSFELYGYDIDLVIDVGPFPMSNTTADVYISHPSARNWNNAMTQPLDVVSYDDTHPVTLATDSGLSLELKSVDLDNNVDSNWAASTNPFGSPGKANQQAAVNDWSMY